MDELNPGTIIDGKFRVTELLGSGGLGSVYRAMDEQLKRQVAVKVLHARTLVNPENTLRFEREARILSELKHPDIVGIYSFGAYSGGYPYMVMEFLEGETLAQTLAAATRLDWRRAVHIAIQIADALAFAHKQGVIHRDIKPQNIMLLSKPEQDSVKVLDFGQSRLLPTGDKEVQRITQTGAVIGSFHYMSPELCSGMPAEKPSDVYSLGCLLYECLTGKPPFEDENPLLILTRHKEVMPKSLSDYPHLKDLPAELEYVVFKCLQKNPMDRFESMDDFRRALDLVLAGRGADITMTKIDLGSNPLLPAKRSMIGVMIVLTLLILSVFACVKWTQTSSSASRSRSKVGKTAVSTARLARIANIERSESFAAEAQRYIESSNFPKAEFALRRSLDFVGQHYSSELRQDPELAEREVRIIEGLSQVAGKLPGPCHGEVSEQLRVTLENNNQVSSDISVRLTTAQARICQRFGHRLYGISRYSIAIDGLTSQGKLAEAKALLAEADAALTGVPPDLRRQEFLVLDMSRLQLLARMGMREQEKKLEKHCLEELPYAFMNDNYMHADFLFTIYQLELNRGDDAAARATFRRTLELVRFPVMKYYETIVDNVSRFSLDLKKFDESIDRVHKLAAMTNNADDRKTALEAEEALKKSKQEFIRERKSKSKYF